MKPGSYVKELAEIRGWRSFVKTWLFWLRISRPWSRAHIQKSQTVKVVRYGRGGAKWCRACYVAA